MKIEFLLLFITFFIFITIGNRQISNFSFISKNNDTIEINEPIVISKLGNNIKFKNTKDNSIRVNKICIHDTKRNKTECISKEEILIAQELPNLRKSMVCIGDSCIGENHSRAINGTGYLNFKTDPLGKKSLQSQSLIWHKFDHRILDAYAPIAKKARMWWWLLNKTGMGKIPDIVSTQNSADNLSQANKSDYFYQLHKLEGVERRPASDNLTAYGASLNSETSVPLFSTKNYSKNNRKSNGKEIF